jgi:hypothetical protein
MTTLGEETDEMNRRFRLLEAKLKGLGYGVAAFVYVAPRCVGEFQVQVGFGKFDNEWRLIYRSRRDVPGEDWEESPLTNVSRAARVMAAPFLPQLPEALKQEAAKQKDEVKDACLILDGLIDALSR